MQYYYEKFNTLVNHTPSFGHNQGGSNFSVTLSNFNSSTSYTYGFSYNPTNSTFTGVSKIVDPTSFPGTFYLAGAILIKYELARIDGVVAYYTRYDASPNTMTTSYSKGSLVQSNIAAEDGTYPSNGRHSDGFWYVKGAAVGPLPPGTVINQPYSTAGNGGRKLVRLKDGTLFVAVISSATDWRIYKSTDNGITFSEFLRKPFSVGDIALTTDGNRLFVAFAHSTVNIKFFAYNADGTVITGIDPVNGKNIDSSQSSLDKVSLTIDPSNGHLYAAWSSKNTTYPNSVNLRYAKSPDGGVTWSTPEQVTKDNDQYKYSIYPSIVVVNGKPFILAYNRNTSAYFISCFSFNGSTWINNSVYSQGTTYNLKGPSAVVDKNGVIHVTWSSGVAADSYFHPFYASSADGVVWSAAKVLKEGNDPSITVDKNNNLVILAVSPFSYINKYTKDGDVWRDKIVPNTNIGNLTNVSTLYDTSYSITFGDTPPAIFQTLNDVRYIGTYSTNTAPSVTLTSPSNNQTLYENDTINLSGDTYDADKDQSVTVYYQINSEQRKVLATNLSQTQITLSKQLTFKGGKLYDGETVLTGTLAEGVAHTLKVWAVDSENGQSAIIERTFYVVPNRAPLLAIDAVVPSGIINTDKFKISGTSSDQDANATVKVTKKVNTNNPVEIYNGPGGAWEFDVSLAELVIDDNTIVVEVIDNYGAKTSKTIKLKKNEVKTPILHAVGRYKISPPKGSAKGVLLFIERDEALDLKVELSMTLIGEQEKYVTLSPVNIAPTNNDTVEDTFEHTVPEEKQNIILKITQSRTDLLFNHKIHLISGAVD